MASILKDMARGSVAGLIGIMAHVGTAQLMWDWTKRTSPENIKREHAIEPKDPFPILADKLGALVGMTPTERQERQFEQYVTVGTGATMGALYAVTARRWPLGWVAGGVVFGTLFWAIEDETMGPALGLAGDNTNIRWKRTCEAGPRTSRSASSRQPSSDHWESAQALALPAAIGMVRMPRETKKSGLARRFRQQYKAVQRKGGQGGLQIST
ncbi:MAG: DUF1440 domain-containing protein [Nitrospirota bacterium]|nr:DUF1440 domain-containing protein [Nitrospirota bacterium]